MIRAWSTLGQKPNHLPDDLGAIRETSAATLDFFRDSAMDWELVLTGPARQRQPGRQLKALLSFRQFRGCILEKARASQVCLVFPFAERA